MPIRMLVTDTTGEPLVALIAVYGDVNSTGTPALTGTASPAVKTAIRDPR